MRDVKRPGTGKAARIGVRDTDREATSRAVAAFSQSLREALDASGYDPESMVMPGKQVVDPLVKTFRGMPAWEAFGISKAIRFSPTAGEGESLLARFLTATETLLMETPWAQKISEALVGHLARELGEDDFGEHEKRIHRQKILEMADQPESQVARFIDFIEDQGMSRVRLHVAVTMLGQIGEAGASNASLERYAGKVVALHEWGVTSDGATVVEPAVWTGVRITLEDYLKRVGAYRPLPVFPEWQSQLFESRSTDRTRVVRNVAYGFRVNGQNPEFKLPAFESRVERLTGIHEGLADHKFALANGSRVLGWMLETLMMWLAANPRIDKGNVVAKAKEQAALLTKEPYKAWGDLLRDLEGFKGEPAAVSKGLREVMRDRMKGVTGAMAHRLSNVTVSVGRGIVAEDIVESGARPGKDYLRSGAVDSTAGTKHETDEVIGWFNHLRVGTKPDPFALFSLDFSMAIQDQGLVSGQDGQRKMALKRSWADAEVLPIVFEPVKTNPRAAAGKGVMASLLSDEAKKWRAPTGCRIFYDPVVLKPPHARDQDPDRMRHAAKVAACTLFLSTLIHYVGGAAARSPRPPGLMLGLRLQKEGKGGGETGENTLYAIVQALEASAGNDLPLRIQGIVEDDGDDFGEQKLRKMRRWGAINALAAAFPLSFTSTPDAIREKVGIIAYRTRPSDDHPQLDRRGYAMEVRVYRFEPGAEGMTFAQLDRGGTHPLDGEEDVGSQHVIKEQISQLARAGFRHIVLLSHHFGNRHLARAAQRHSPHTRTGFVDEIAAQFPDLHLYPMRKDVFSAFRVRNAGDGFLFEAENLGDQPGIDLLSEGKKLIPVYTAATLLVVGQDGDGRPQSGFATYFLDVDDEVRTTTFRERSRQVLLGGANPVRSAITDAFRGMHFLEAEKPAKDRVLPATLDPLGWTAPTVIAGAGELDILPSRRSGRVIFCITAFAGLVTDMLRARHA